MVDREKRSVDVYSSPEQVRTFTEADTLDKVEPHDLAMNATAMAVMAFQLANLDPPLARYVPPKTEDSTKPPGIRR